MTSRSVIRQGINLVVGPNALSSGLESAGEVVTDSSIVSDRDGLLHFRRTRIATHNMTTTPPPMPPPAIARMFGLRVDDALAEERDDAAVESSADDSGGEGVIGAVAAGRDAAVEFSVEDMDVGVAARSSGL